jgi:hypothetical protein
MKVLYIGQPGTARADRWSAFLTDQGFSVRSAGVSDLGSLDFADADLAVVDGDPHEAPFAPDQLDATALPLPTVLIGGVGGRVSDAIGLKLGWDFGCLCLDHRAIIEDATRDHAVFQGPVPLPSLTTRTIPATENFLQYVATKTVPEKFTVVDIHAPDDSDEEASRPGLVSTSVGFLDSPDCEHILGGINMKAHDYNAVGRQGRFLQWGFYGDPSELTELGRALFINCLHYISSFADAPVEALRVQWSREFLHTGLGFLDFPESGDSRDRLMELFGPDLPEGIGTTTASALAWYAERGGYLRHEGVGHNGRFVVDSDLLALGVANNDPALLEALAVTLDDTDAEVAELARRLWNRYVRRIPDDAATEREWFTRHRDQMFFSDWAGYRWIARTDPPTLTIPRTGTADAGPVYLWLTADRTGPDLRLNVNFLMRPGHYIYSPGADDGIVTTVEVVSDHTVVTPAAFPETENRHLYGRVTVPMTVRGAADTVELAVRVQSCDEQSCTPPTTVRVQATTGT